VSAFPKGAVKKVKKVLNQKISFGKLRKVWAFVEGAVKKSVGQAQICVDIPIRSS